MKLTNIQINGRIQLAEIIDNEVFALDTSLTTEDIIRQGSFRSLEGLKKEKVDNPVYANLVSSEKVICVGLNYPKHTAGIKMKDPDYPVLFNKFRDSLIPHNDQIIIHEGEDTYDYEGELVVVMGKRAFRIRRKKQKTMSSVIPSVMTLPAVMSRCVQVSGWPVRPCLLLPR